MDVRGLTPHVESHIQAALGVGHGFIGLEYDSSHAAEATASRRDTQG